MSNVSATEVGSTPHPVSPGLGRGINWCPPENAEPRSRNWTLVWIYGASDLVFFTKRTTR